ncbi:hypothetical protein ACVWY3_000737 [Bradyrhizobium sp. USDA 4486]
MSNLSFHLSSDGPEELLAPSAATSQEDAWAPATGRQLRKPHQTAALDRRTAHRGRKPPGTGTLGSRFHDVLPIRPGSNSLIVLHERQSRFKIWFTATRIEKLFPRLKPSPTSSGNCHRRAPNHQLRQWQCVRRKPSASHYARVLTFFCDPHSPWQKGGVENSIGRLRRWLPRKTDLNLLTAADLRRHAHRLNNTPRKCLDFKTPAEAFSNSNQPLHFKRKSINGFLGDCSRTYKRLLSVSQ